MNSHTKKQLESVKQNRLAIQFIKNPSEKIKLEAVQKLSSNIFLIDNPSEELQLIAVILPRLKAVGFRGTTSL